MKRLFLSLLLVLFIAAPAWGDIQTITHTVRQAFGGSQSADDARIAAVAKAKREALERAGTYVEAVTVVKDQRLDRDEILALAAGICRAEVVSTKNYVTGEAFGIEVKVKVAVDTAVLEGRVKKLLEDRQHLEQLNDARKREKDLLEKIARLEADNRNLQKTAADRERLAASFRETSRGLTAVDWFGKALALWKHGRFEDPRTAIRSLDEAIRLSADYPEALALRAVAYDELGQYERALADGSAAIRLKPDLALAFNNRGIVHRKLDQYEKALADYTEAIRLKPDFAEAFNNRGIAYDDLRQYDRAIADYTEAIRLKPDYAQAYYNRGISHRVLGRYAQAIADYTEAFRLKPDYAKAVNNRGIAYIFSGDNERGCRDLQQACAIGMCQGLDYWRKEGKCR